MRSRTARRIVSTALAGATAIILAFGYLGGSARANDAVAVVNNALKATSVAGGFDASFKETMYVMTVTNGDTNDIVSVLNKNGALSNFVTLPPRASGETSPRVDVTTVRAADGEFKNYLHHLLVSRGQRIYLITPGGAIVGNPNPLINMGTAASVDCPSINSIVVGSELFDRRLIAACSNGKLYTIFNTGTWVADLLVDLNENPSTLGRIDIAPANFFHNGVNYARRIVAYRQSDRKLLFIGPGVSQNPSQIPVIAVQDGNGNYLLPTTTTAAARAVPSILCSYLNSPADGTVIASDAFVRTNNRNAIYRSPRTEYSGREGQVLLFGSDGSRVLAQWGGPGPVLNTASPVTFSQVHPAGTPAFNGMAFCPVFYVQVQVSPTSATPGSPGQGITTGNITFIIVSIRDASGNILLEPQSAGSLGVNQATIAFGPTGTEATAVGDEVKCTKSQTDVNNDGLADLHCSAKASAAMLPEGANGVVTFVTNGGNPRAEAP